MVQRKWDKLSIISELKKLQAMGEDIRPGVLHRNHSNLAQAGRRYFGPSQEMYKAAGIDLLELNIQLAESGIRTRKCGRYDKDSIVPMLLELQSRGEDIAVSSLTRRHKGLWSAGVKFFGNSWNMYIAAGLPPGKYCQLKPSGYWTKPRIMEEIKRMHTDGEDLHYSAIRKNHSDLESAAANKFGGWHKACAASDIPKSSYHIVDPRGTWNKVTIGARFQAMQEAGEDLAETTIRHNPTLQGLLSAAHRQYGNWYNALKENGINPDKYRRQAVSGFWTEERITDTILRMFERKEDLGARHVSRKHSDLFHAASKVFGNYENAVNKAGIDYDSIRKQHKEYSEAELLDYLKSLQTQGYLLHVALVKGISYSMVNIIINRFGSWKAAIERLGLDYDKVRRDGRDRIRMGKVFELYLLEALDVLGRATQFQRTHHFGKDKVRPDFVDLRTDTWIDAKLNSYSTGVSETIWKYQKLQKKVEIIYLDGEDRIWPDGSVDFIPISTFYEALNEVGAEHLVKDFEMLKKGIIRPDLQSGLDDYQIQN